MTFNDTNLKTVLLAIEESISFNGDDITNPSKWDFKINLDVHSILNKSPNEKDKLRYVIKTLQLLGYIGFANSDYSLITSITPTGLKFLFKELHNIDFI